MVSIKFVCVLVILASLLSAEFVEAGAKKQRHNIKHKKSGNNGKLKASFKQAPAQSKANQRNAKMNFYNSHSWPSSNSYYRPASSTPLFLRSSTPSMFYPMHWGNSYFNTPSYMSSNNMFKRSDDFSTTPTMTSSIQSPMMSSSQTPMMSMSSSQTPMMSLGSSQTPMLSLGNSQTPTILDMSAFTGSGGLMDNPFTSSSQNIWSMGGDVPSPKPKFNFFNSFNLNDDGLFGNLFNQFR